MEQIREIFLEEVIDNGNALTLDGVMTVKDNFSFSDSDNSLKIHALKSSRPRKLRFVPVLICKNGCISLKVNLQTFSLKAFDCMLFPTGAICEIVSVSENCRIAAVAFSENAFNLPIKNLLSQDVKKKLMVNPMLVSLGDNFCTLALQYYNLIRKILSDNSLTYQVEMVKSNINIILALIAQCYEQSEKDVVLSRNEQIFNAFLQSVKDNCIEDRTVNFYASKLCISTKYLSKVVKNVSGRTPSDWIADYVVLNAKTLLDENYTALQVSEMLNFPNPSFFGKFFKAQTGITPMQYRKRTDN